MTRSKRDSLKVWKLDFFYLVVIATGLLSLSGCQAQHRSSFIVIAVDRLAFNAFSCSDEKSNLTSGLSSLCKEALRFTHAYTTSPQPAASLASLLTGTYPYVHGIHRSSDRVEPRQKMWSELAVARGYRTSFFSGSPSILKKTGLSRGFEIFDDLTFLERKNYLLDFKRQGDMALSWMQESPEAFLSVIYNSELESLNEGQTDVSTFEKLDEKLAQFFADLKQHDLWERNYVVVVGTQGQSDYSRPEETLSSNLHSENTNVILFIKPPRQKGDEGTNWKVDTAVNTADLGLSLMKTMAPDEMHRIDETFPVLDFSTLWTKANSDFSFPDGRRLLVETVNPWKRSVESRFTILFKNLVYLENEVDELYNTLNDGLETIDISSTATPAQNDFKNENRKILAGIRLKKNQTPWTEFKPEWNDFVLLNRDYWAKPNTRTRLLDSEYERFKAVRISQPLTLLMVQSLVASNRQDQLKALHLKIDLKRPAAEKEAAYEDARRQSLNLSLENIWGLWTKEKNWLQTPFISEYQ